jgi:hypothetical protein
LSQTCTDAKRSIHPFRLISFAGKRKKCIIYTQGSVKLWPWQERNKG